MNDLIAQTRYATIAEQSSNNDTKFKNLDTIDNKNLYMILNQELAINKSSPTITFKGFNFDIPKQSIIKGIIVTIKRKGTGIKDELIKINKNSENLAKNIDWQESEYCNYGSTNHLWNLELKPEDINNENFDLIFKCKSINEKSSIPSLFYVAITIYFKKITYTMRSSFIKDKIYILNIEKDSEEFKKLNIDLITNLTIRDFKTNNGDFIDNQWHIDNFIENQATLKLFFNKKYNNSYINAIIQETGQKNKRGEI